MSTATSIPENRKTRGEYAHTEWKHTVNKSHQVTSLNKTSLHFDAAFTFVTTNLTDGHLKEFGQNLSK